MEPDEARSRVVVVFGGTGFLGRRIVSHLLDHGIAVRVAVRHPERVRELFGPKRAGLEAVAADVGDENAVGAALSGAMAVINAVSLYVEHGEATFHSVHVEAAARVARLCRTNKVNQLVHVSGIGSDPRSSSPYIRARGDGELAVRDAYQHSVLIRPAVMFGADDAFLTTIIRLLKRLPVYPMFGNGKTKLQPVYVEDVGEAISRLIRSPPEGELYEFGGPRVYAYEDLLRSIAQQIGVRPRLVPMAFPIWTALAAAAEHVPGVNLTRNQVALMRRDNLASSKLPGLAKLDVNATAVEEIVAEIETGRRS